MESLQFVRLRHGQYGKKQPALPVVSVTGYRNEGQGRQPADSVVPGRLQALQVFRQQKDQVTAAQVPPWLKSFPELVVQARQEQLPEDSVWTQPERNFEKSVRILPELVVSVYLAQM
jgi:hypothetical protein